MSLRLAGAAIFVIAAFFTWYGGSYEAAFGDVLGPGVFPVVIGIPALLLSASIVAIPGGSVAWPAPGRLAGQAAALAILIAYAMLLRPLGFPLATGLLMAGLGIVLGGAVWKSALLGALVAPALWALFDQALGLPLAFVGTWLS